MSLETILAKVKVIPVLIIEDVDKAVPLAKALKEGGLTVLEVTLRTDCALQAIKEMSQIEDVVVGVGTLTCHNDVTDALACGAQFGVSPGSPEGVLDACEHERLPLLPGIDNVTDAMRNYDRGFTIQKFFPAEQSGGAGKLKALSSPLPHVRFCPTGGINHTNAADYLSLPNVTCVGGSWVAPESAVVKGEWDKITRLSEDTCRLSRSYVANAPS